MNAYNAVDINEKGYVANSKCCCKHHGYPPQPFTEETKYKTIKETWCQSYVTATLSKIPSLYSNPVRTTVSCQISTSPSRPWLTKLPFYHKSPFQ